MLVKVVARIPEKLRGLKITKGKLHLWDSHRLIRPRFARSMRQLDGGEVELEFEVPDQKLSYITDGERFDILLGVDEKREDCTIRRWATARPISVKILG